MTNRHLLLLGLLTLLSVWRAEAQFTPQGFSYQCIVRDNNGASLNNQTVNLLFTIRNGAPNGPVSYSEMQTSSTNEFGLINLFIGQGTALQGTFSTINWGGGSKYLTVSVETAPGVFDELGTSQLMSVPYALYAQNTASSGDNWGTQTVQTAPTLSGTGTTTTPLTIAQQGAQPGQVLKWNGTTWVPEDDNTGQSGTVSEINTGAGLEGGPITTTGTISLANSPVTPGLYGSNTQIPVITVDQYGRVTGISLADIQPSTVNITGNTGIGVVQNGQDFTITNTGDTDPADDITTTSVADGDVAGPFSNLQIKPNAVGNAEIVDNAVSTSKIADGAVATGKIADSAVNTPKIANGAVTAAKLNDMGATSGQVLKWTGTMWAPAQDALGVVNLTGGTGINVTGANPNFTIINTGDTNPGDDITTGSTADGDVAGPFSNLQLKAGVVSPIELANNAVTTTKINAQAVTGDKIDQMSAANGQVLKWTGTTWAPAPDNMGVVTITGGVGIDVIGAGQNFVIANGGDVNPFDDLTVNSIADGDIIGPFSNLQIRQGVVTNFELANNAVQTAKIQNAAVTGEKIAQMSALNGQILKWNGTAWAPAPDLGPDNWGTQTVVTSAALSGLGTSLSPLTLDQQGAAAGQILKWNGNFWLPADDNNSGPDNWGTQTAVTNATITGNGTAATPLGLATQGAANGQVLKFNGTTWLPADDNNSGPDNWGTQTAVTNATITGNGTAATPLGLATQGAANGQVLKFNGTTWLPADDNNSGPDNWGTQVVESSLNIDGDGTPSQPLRLAQFGATDGQVLKWNTAANLWTPADDIGVSGGDDWGAQVATTDATLTGDGANTPLGLADQGATPGQVLKFDGTTWVPQDEAGGDDWGNQAAATSLNIIGNGTAGQPLRLASFNATSGQVLSWNPVLNLWVPADDTWGTQVAATNPRLTGNGTAGSPLDIAPQNAAPGQVLKFNGTTWVPEDDEVATAGSGDDWGTQTVVADATLTGNGTNLGPLGLAAQGATTGQVLKFNGTTWVPEDDNDSGPDDWGTQVASVSPRLTGNGTAGSPLDIAVQGATSGQVLKFNGTTWVPGDDTGGANYSAGAGISITGTPPNLVISNTGDADNDPANEIQTLSINGPDLTLSNGGGTVTLPTANNYAAGAGIAITGSAPNFTIENTGDTDNDPTNELQSLSLNGTLLSISATNSTVNFDTLFSNAGVGLWTPSGSNIYNANSGNVGVGTNMPLRKFHVRGMGEIIRVQGIEPGIGFAHGNNLGSVISQAPGALSIATEDSSAIVLTTGGGKAVFVDGTTGNVGMGFANVNDARLKLFHAAGEAGLMIENATSGGHWDFRVNGFDGSLNLHNNFFGGGLPVGIFATNGFYTPSDKRFKKDIVGTGSILDKVAALNPVYYHYNQESADAKRTIGFVAQEVDVLFPELVSQHRAEDGNTYLGVNYAGFGVLAIKAIQEQQEQINVLLQEKNQLLQRLNSLEARMQRIEQARASTEK
ncbi:MAG: tail fiber domain-containing protein [Lewinellaceae bacterium]|nr:tail fiber domain-containing protein [Lewinellaceae bacterium]